MEQSSAWELHTTENPTSPPVWAFSQHITEWTIYSVVLSSTTCLCVSLGYALSQEDSKASGRDSAYGSDNMGSCEEPSTSKDHERWKQLKLQLEEKRDFSSSFVPLSRICMWIPCLHPWWHMHFFQDIYFKGCAPGSRRRYVSCGAGSHLASLSGSSESLFDPGQHGKESSGLPPHFGLNSFLVCGPVLTASWISSLALV